MLNPKGLPLILCLILLLTGGGIASGQCDPDGNNSSAEADLIGYSETVSDYVCPDDPFDYYYVDVAQGAILSGQITFSAEQTGTTIRIDGPSGNVYSERGTLDSTRTFVIQFPPGHLQPGRYYIRIGHYSAYAYDHSYTIAMNLGVDTGCIADNNEDPANATPISIGDEIDDWLCDIDHMDIYKFTVSNSFFGKINLYADPGELFLYLYDSNQTELYQGKTEGGELKYEISSDASLSAGDYYIGVFLPLQRNDENSYSLRINRQFNIGKIEPVGVAELGPQFQAGGVHSFRPMAGDVWVRIVADSLFCDMESYRDEGSTSDEPYIMFEAFADHQNPSIWSTGSAKHFSDVDDNENRKFNTSDTMRVIYEGMVPEGATVGFDVTMKEGDTVTSDDFICENAVRFPYDYLTVWDAVPVMPLTMYLSGYDEGIYFLRYHLEFDRLACTNFSAKFTNWDAFTTGYLGPGMNEELILTAIDEDASGNMGKFYVRNALGMTLRTFEIYFREHDKVECGNLDGVGFDEIVVASKYNGGMVNTYDSYGNQTYSFAAPFTAYDGLAVADVDGDGKCEILIAKDDNDTIYTYDAKMNYIREFKLNFDFKGVRSTADNTRHDAFLAGDIAWDNKAEIVMIENKNGTDSIVRIYEGDFATGFELRNFILGNRELFYCKQNYPSINVATKGTFTHNDAATLADVVKDDKLELVIATDSDAGLYGYTVKVYDLIDAEMLYFLHWPLFTKYDGFAAGDVLGKGNDQLLVASDDDDKVYVTMAWPPGYLSE
jgi:hypothetical protein